MEGQGFEKYKIPQPETGPEFDIETILEKGEIESAETLKGYFPIKIIRIKDDGRALFKPISENRNLDSKNFLRADLELLAAQIDEILGFNLVPPTVSRNLENTDGILQRFEEDSEIAANLGGWPELVNNDEFIKAAVFDFILGSRDRHGGNFLVSAANKKIWLIDHDYYMLLDYRGTAHGSDILRQAIRNGPLHIPRETTKALAILLEKIDYLKQSAKSEIIDLLESIQERTKKLIEIGILA